MKGINVSKFTIYFKMKLVNILDKYSKFKRSFLSLNFFKDYLKTVAKYAKRVKKSSNNFL